MPRPGLLEIAGEEEVYQRGHGCRHLVGHHRNEPVASAGNDREGDPVVTGEHRKVRRPRPDDIHDLLEISAGLLEAHDVVMASEPQSQVGLQIDAGSPRHVVQADGLGGGVGHRGEMPVEAFLGGLVVVRCGAQDVVRAESAHPFRFIHRAGGVIAGSTCHHRHPTPGNFDHSRNHSLALRVVEGLRLAGRAAGYQKVDAFRNLPVHQRPQRREIDGAVPGEGRDQGGAASLEAGQVESPNSMSSKVNTPVWPGSHSAAESTPAAKTWRLRVTWLREMVSNAPRR